MNELYSLCNCERQLIQWGIAHIDLQSIVSTDEVDSLINEFQKLQNDHTNTLHRYSVDVTKSSFPHKKIFTFCTPWISTLWKIEPTNLKFHGGFIIHYGEGTNDSLKLHTDDSDITINFCLYANCEGSQVHFFGKKPTAIMQPQFDLDRTIHIQTHSRWALIHLGSHQHETTPIIEGDRWNVVLWYKKVA